MTNVCVNQPAGLRQPVCFVLVIDYVDNDAALIASMKMYRDSMTDVNLEVELMMCVCELACLWGWPLFAQCGKFAPHLTSKTARQKVGHPVNTH